MGLSTNISHPWRPTHFAVIGAGAMGLSLTAVLGKCANVTIVARNPELAQQIRERGVVVQGLAHIRSRAKVVSSARELLECEPIDAIFVATKTSAIDQVGDELRPLLPQLRRHGQQLFVVSFQNGIESGRALMARLNDPAVLRMVLNYGAQMNEDGTVRVMFSSPPHAIGSLDSAYADACRVLAEMLTRGGMESRAVEDIEPIVWTKGIINAAMNPVAALLNSSIGEVLDSPARVIVERLLDEGLRVATCEGIALGEGAKERILRGIENARAHTPSMVEDIRAGRPSEVGQLNRQIVEHARRIGLRASDHELITALIDAFDWRVFHRQRF